MSAIEIEDQTEIDADIRHRCCPGCGKVVAIVTPNDGNIYVRHGLPMCAWMTPANTIVWLHQVFDPSAASAPS